MKKIKTTIRFIGGTESIQFRGLTWSPGQNSNVNLFARGMFGPIKCYFGKTEWFVWNFSVAYCMRVRQLSCLLARVWVQVTSWWLFTRTGVGANNKRVGNKNVHLIGRNSSCLAGCDWWGEVDAWTIFFAHSSALALNGSSDSRPWRHKTALLALSTWLN